MEKDGPQTRGQGLCKHEDTVHTRHLILCRFKSGIRPRRERAQSWDSCPCKAPSPGDAKFPFFDWSLCDGSTGILQRISCSWAARCNPAIEPRCSVDTKATEHSLGLRKALYHMLVMTCKLFITVLFFLLKYLSLLKLCHLSLGALKGKDASTYASSFTLLLTLACFISSSAISMKFFLKATTRLPLKLVSSVRIRLCSLKRKCHFRHKETSAEAVCIGYAWTHTPFFPDSESLSNFCRHCRWCSSAWGISLLFSRALSKALLEFS